MSALPSPSEEQPFDRQRFEAEARAAAPPMPADMSTPRDEADLVSIFWWTFGVVWAVSFVAPIFTGSIGFIVGPVAGVVWGALVVLVVWLVRRGRAAP